MDCASESPAVRSRERRPPFAILHMPLVTLSQIISQWRTLGTIEPAALVSSRETLHHAAQLLALAGASYLEPRDDDSHTSMSWLAAFGALATEPIPAAAPFRFALQVRELRLVVFDDASADAPAAFSLQGRTRSDALAWMRREADRRGLDGDRLLSRLHFAIAPHPTDEGRPFERATDGTLDELASWYADASLILDNTRRRMEGAEPVRCWPHHFDIATLVRLPQVGAVKTIGVGLSPGDESCAEPYYYVSLSPKPARRPRPLSVGRWHTEGWWGGALVGSEIVKQRMSDHQAGFVTRFIEDAVERLLETNDRGA